MSPSANHGEIPSNQTKHHRFRIDDSMIGFRPFKMVKTKERRFNGQLSEYGRSDNRRRKGKTIEKTKWIYNPSDKSTAKRNTFTNTNTSDFDDGVCNCLMKIVYQGNAVFKSGRNMTA
ncbi:hypothetical protein AAHA92_02753 [Salvia divinorum]|uniref:Uncharacterized protein n=1 Tax=Salvia divinorum TaxID=28513 RepID=A0ABD1IEX6_SALDI